MKIYCGTDIVQIERLERAVTRQGDRFLERIFTPREIALCTYNPDPKDNGAARYNFASLAVRFAGKEAIAKALGTGIGPQQITWQDLEILRDQKGAPIALLHGAAKTRLTALEGISVAISLSHEQTIAQAFCVILSESVAPQLDESTRLTESQV